MSYAIALEKFQQGILEAKPATALPLLRNGPRCPADILLNIYIEGYRIRLGKAVQNDYPCLEHYLGHEVLQKLVADYIEVTPSCSYNLDYYPFGLWRYVGMLCEQKEAADLAELEGTVAEVFMMPDSDPLTVTDLNIDSEEKLGEAHFYMRTASRFLNQAYDVELYYQQFRAGSSLGAIEQKQTHLLIVRHNNEVKRHILEPEEFALLQNISAGLSFTEAICMTHADQAMLSQKIGLWLSRWIEAGFFRRSLDTNFAIEPQTNKGEKI